MDIAFTPLSLIVFLFFALAAWLIYKKWYKTGGTLLVLAILQIIFAPVKMTVDDTPMLRHHNETVSRHYAVPDAVKQERKTVDDVIKENQ